MSPQLTNVTVASKFWHLVCHRGTILQGFDPDTPNTFRFSLFLAQGLKRLVLDDSSGSCPQAPNPARFFLFLPRAPYLRRFHWFLSLGRQILSF